MASFGRPVTAGGVCLLQVYQLHMLEVLLPIAFCLLSLPKNQSEKIGKRINELLLWVMRGAPYAWVASHCC